MLRPGGEVLEADQLRLGRGVERRVEGYCRNLVLREVKAPADEVPAVGEEESDESTDETVGSPDAEAGSEGSFRERVAAKRDAIQAKKAN